MQCAHRVPDHPTNCHTNHVYSYVHAHAGHLPFRFSQADFMGLFDKASKSSRQITHNEFVEWFLPLESVLKNL